MSDDFIALGERFEQGCWQIKVLLVCFKIVIYSFLILKKACIVHRALETYARRGGGLFYFMLTLQDRVASQVLLH